MTTTDSNAGLNAPSLDAKGRKSIHDMNDGEKLNEILAINRALQDLVEGFFDDMKNGKLQLPGPLGMMMKMMGGK